MTDSIPRSLNGPAQTPQWQRRLWGLRFLFRPLETVETRRPLTWERNNIDLLILEGTTFICPWTRREITQGIAYDLDHLVPVSVYPINELWNLLPADPKFNSQIKRDRLPTVERLQQAQPYFELAYRQYHASKSLAQVLQEDAAIRFSRLQHDAFTKSLADAVVDFIEQVAETRNLGRFG